MGGQTADFSSAQGFDFSEFLKHFSSGSGFSSGSVFGDIFGDLAGGGGGQWTRRGTTYYYTTGGRPQESHAGEDTDIKAVLPIPVDLAKKGGEAKFKLSSGKTITLKIPRGTRNGQKMRLKGQGRVCPHCQHKGDLIVTVKVQ